MSSDEDTLAADHRIFGPPYSVDLLSPGLEEEMRGSRRQVHRGRVLREECVAGMTGRDCYRCEHRWASETQYVCAHETALLKSKERGLYRLTAEEARAPSGPCGPEGRYFLVKQSIMEWLREVFTRKQVQ